MLKNKKSLYFLIPAVVGLWGLIIIRLFEFSTDENLDPIGGFDRYVDKVDQEEQIEVQLNLNYPDPFLKGLQPAKTRPRINNTETLGKQIKPPSEKKEELPDDLIDKFTYSGYMNSGSNNLKVGLLDFDGEVLLVSTGDVVEGFEIGAIEKDSILLVNGRKVLTIKLNGLN